MAAYDYLYHFCNFCVSFAKILQSQKQNMQTIFTEMSGEGISHIGKSLVKFSRNLLSNHKEDW